MQDDRADTVALTADPVPLPPLVAPDRVLHSDPHDFAGLYIRHRSSFTLHARRYLNDARDADEVVQEAFLRLFLALPELETELQALAYCRRTITNLCIDRYRAQARRPRLVDLDSVDVEDLAGADLGDPVVRAEDAAIVRDALSMLTPLHRAALVKREIEEKPLPVIAEELDIAEDSVKHVLFRARRALRRLLATTSLAPGRDAEGAGRVGLSRAGSSGLAALLLLAVLGLGSGPNLTVIPVVGEDLPDLPGVTEFAKVVGKAVTDVSRAVTQSVTSSQPGKDTADAPAGTPDAGLPSVGAGDEASIPAPADVARTADSQSSEGEGSGMPGAGAEGAGSPGSGAPAPAADRPAAGSGPAAPQVPVLAPQPGLPAVPSLPTPGGGVVVVPEVAVPETRAPAEPVAPTTPPSDETGSGAAPVIPDTEISREQQRAAEKAAKRAAKQAARAAAGATVQASPDAAPATVTPEASPLGEELGALVFEP